MCTVSTNFNANVVNDNCFENQCNANSENIKASVKTNEIILWGKANWKAMENFIQNINWESYFCNTTNPESCWEAFSEILSFAISKYVPQRKIKLFTTCKKTRTKKNSIVRKLRTYFHAN